MKYVLNKLNIIARLAEANRYVQNHLDKRYRPLEISGYDHVYITLACRNPGISQKDLKRYLTVDQSNITRNVIRLEKSGFIRRERDEKDKRVWRIYLTEKSQKNYQTIVQIFDDLQDEILKDFTQEEKENLSDYLIRIKNHLSKKEEKL